MNAKPIIAASVVVGSLFVAVVFVNKPEFISNTNVENSSSNIQTSVDEKITSPDFDDNKQGNSTDHAESVEKAVAKTNKTNVMFLKEQANAKKLEIERLIIAFNDDIKDKTRRNELKVKIDQLTKEYNELILPIALSAVKSGN